MAIRNMVVMVIPIRNYYKLNILLCDHFDIYLIIVFFSGIKGFEGLVPPIMNGFIMDIYKMPLAKILDDCPQELELNVQFLLEYVMSFHNTINQLIENIRDNTKVDWDNFSKSSSCLLYLKFNEIVHYVPRRRMRVIAGRATMLAGDRS